MRLTVEVRTCDASDRFDSVGDVKTVPEGFRHPSCWHWRLLYCVAWWQRAVGMLTADDSLIKHTSYNDHKKQQRSSSTECRD